MSLDNHYHILQVQPTADLEVIEAAAKALLKKHHPDLGGRNTLSAQVNKSRSVLTDRSKRADFDAELRSQLNNNIGPYRVIRKLSEGGFGRVYEAQHTLLDEKTCIKHSINISDYDRKLFINEAKAVWNLRHHSLPAVRDVMVLDDGSVAIIMTFIEGPTLAELAEEYQKKGGPNGEKEIHPENVCWLMDRVLDALRYMHWHGVVHGDVKPQNIIVQRDQHTCALVDFGLSTVRPDKNDGVEGYTPAFASPEALKFKPLLPESDLYSLGLTFIHAVGGDVAKKRVPMSLPKPIRDFISDLVVFDIAHRPCWDKVDLVEKLRKIRLDVFGRAHTNLKKI
jgi:serine/threonine protein kinase